MSKLGATMTESEWLTSDEPDLMLEQITSTATRAQLIEFVRSCWSRVAANVPAGESAYTVVEQFEELAPEQSDYDATIYASEAALKAAGLADDRRTEQRFQAELLRRIMGKSFVPPGT
jgi:hypothetical protein